MAGAKISVLGAFVADLTCRTDRMANWGETILGNAFKLGPGGKGSNQAVAAARLGAEVTLITKVGRDAFGDLARSFYRQEAMSLNRILEDPEETSGTATIVIDETTQENAIIVVPGAAGKLSVEDVEASALPIEQSQVFLTQLELPIPPTLRGIELAYAAGVPVLLNPAPALALPVEIFPKIDYLTPNESEAAGLLGSEPLRTDAEIERALDQLLDFGIKNVVITLGDRGAIFQGNGNRGRVPAFHLGPVIETTGAGDAFAGGFAVALAEGASLEAATRFGCAVAGLSVTRAGTAPSMPRREEVEKVLRL